MARHRRNHSRRGRLGVAALLGIALAAPPAAVAAATPADTAAATCAGADAIAINRTLVDPAFGAPSQVTIDLAKPVPAGSYRVTLVSYDNHNPDKLGQTDQTGEQWHVTLLGPDGTAVYQSPPIADLPDADNYLVQQVASAASVTGTATRLRAAHLGAGRTFDSITAVCAVFTSLEPAIDLELAKTAAPTTLPVGAQTTFTLTLFNRGPGPAANIAVRDTLPAGLTYAGHSGDGAFDAGSFTWRVASLPAGASVKLDIRVTATAVGTFTNIAEVTEATGQDVDSTPNNQVPGEDDQAVATVTVGSVLGAIGDTVWFDENLNGTQEAGEVGILGARVTLTSPSGGSTTATTDAAGTYLFSGLAAGTYTVEVDTGLVPTGTTPTTATMLKVPLPAGATYLDADFGFGPAGGTGRIGDAVWDDQDGDGVQDPGEPGIGGVTVRLTSPGGSSIAAVTDAAGGYLFQNLAAGSYTAAIDLATAPGGTRLTTPGSVTVDLAAGQSFLDADFGLVTLQVAADGSIGDLVWLDTNANGRVDTGEEGIAGVGLTLTTATGATATTTSNADGKYLFSGLAAGSYTVRVGTGPAGTVPTTPASYAVTLAEGQVYLDADFGLAAGLPATGAETQHIALLALASLVTGTAVIIETNRRLRRASAATILARLRAIAS